MCFNEQAAIEKVIDDCYSVLSKMTNDFEVIVVDDGSSDNSKEIIKQLISTKYKNLIFIDHVTNKGIGATLHSSYKNMKKENVVVICGDGQFEVRELLPYKSIEPQTIVSFYRLENTVYGLARNVLSLINRLINKYLLGIKLRDVNWIKVYKRKELEKIDLKIKSSLVESEICSKLILNKNKLIEVESKYHVRIGGQSKGSSFKIVMQAMKDIILLIMEIVRFRIFK